VGHQRNRKEIKVFLEANKNENTTYQGHSKGSASRGGYIAMNAYILKNQRTFK
jgi:hypothetical protein